MPTGKAVESPTQGQDRDQSDPGESKRAIEENSLWTTPGRDISSRRTRSPSSTTNNITLWKSKRPNCLAYQADFHQHETREATKRFRLPGPRQPRHTQHNDGRSHAKEKVRVLERRGPRDGQGGYPLDAHTEQTHQQHETDEVWTAKRKKPDTPEKDTSHTSIGETHSTSTRESHSLLPSRGIRLHGHMEIWPRCCDTPRSGDANTRQSGGGL